MLKRTHPVDVHVGQKIRQVRWQKGMTQTQLAEQVGVKFQQLQKYETAANRVSASRLFDIANVLEVSTSIFFPSENESADTVSFSKEEVHLLQTYRTASKEMQRTFLSLLQEATSLQK